ncbi:MAG: protein kinase [Verrucomicrobiota bacterium]|jgi:uncharacterized membrane protein/predicted Ser/Thr protein kinase
METKKICPNCRKPLPPDVPLGLCPECLIKSGFPTGTEPGTAGEAAGTRFVPPPVAEIAQLFPQLEILRLIGQGGMGAVYKARQPTLDRFVALKVLPPVVASDPGFAERFNREARALARLNHPNIVAVHDFGKAGALPYLLMEFVDGANLREVEQAGELTPEKALAIVPQICEALQFAHNEGIVHRDIKPENLLLDKKGRVKITDFGIAKIVGAPAGKVSLTGVKDVVGTPHYMAPEQIEKPQTVDHRADIYSLGVVFYEMLTGELPLGKFQPPSKKVQIDVRLDEVVLHTLEKEPSRRYQQVSQVKTDVETIAGTAPVDTETLTREILSRDYVLDIGSCLSRGWALLQNNFWPVVGITALIVLLRHAADSSLIGIVVGGPLMGGLWLYYLKKIRGEQAGLETVFSSFSIAFLHLFLAGLITMVLTVLGIICLILPGIYLAIAWLFTLPLVIDKRLDFWPAMGLSRKTISKHWWKFLGFIIILGLINLAGLLACFVGLLITVPLSLAAMMYAYEDIFGPTSRTASLLASDTVQAKATALAGTSAKSPRSNDGTWKVVVIAAAAAMLILAILFGALFVPALSKARQRAAMHQATANFMVRGVVSDAATGKPIAGARVADNIYGARTNRTPREAWTDATGRYELKTWYEEHSIAASAPGYETKLATLFTKPLGKKKEAQMDFQLQPARANAPATNGDSSMALNISSPEPTAIPPAAPRPPTTHPGKVIGNLSTSDPYQQDFNQTLLLSANGRLRLDNVNGRIEIFGWDRNEVSIKALKHGKTQESVEDTKIVVDSSPDEIAIHTEQPSSQNGPFGTWSWLMNGGIKMATVDYVIQVPRSTRLKEITSVNGRIAIEDVNGDIEASTVNGEMQVAGTAGDLELSTVNGRIAAELVSLGRGQSVSFDSVNGKIEVTLPANANAEVSADVVNGSITSEFPALAVQKEFPLGKKLKGTLGNGGASVKANAVNGRISFRMGQDAQKSGVKQSETEDAGQTVAGLQPVVVETQPVSGARDVEPGVTEIRVRFSKEMEDGSWSWSTAWENSAPEIIGQPYYESDGRTCVAKVKLEPGRTYAWWLNSDKFKNFTDLAGRPAVPYLLIFQTKQN